MSDGVDAWLMAGEPVDSGSERLIGRVEGAIGRLVFNNPARRNAVSRDMWDGIAQVMAALEADPRVRAIVLAGAGGKAFVAGADLTEFNKLGSGEDAGALYKASAKAGRSALTGATKPLIAMIDGYCIGGGMVVALSCDIRIASERSRFGIPAARLGLGYGEEGVKQLVDLLGPGVARDLLFSARQIDAEEALRIGLVSQVVSAETLASHVAAYAEQIAANAPLTVRTAKLTVAELLKPDAERDHNAITLAIEACFASADYVEGRRAFAEKRAPIFTGS